jgi:hypothetical protein
MQPRYAEARVVNVLNSTRATAGKPFKRQAVQK